MKTVSKLCSTKNIKQTKTFIVLGTDIKMLVGYARVSTIDQDPQLQIDALKKADCEKIFTDKASGKNRERPALQEVLNFLRPNDTLIVWKLSRLARSVKEIIYLAELLSKKDISLKVITQNIDTSSPEGRLFFHITAAFDEFQRELIVENTKAGLATARANGRHGGRPQVLPPNKRNLAETMLKDPKNYPSISEIIKTLEIGRTTFYRYFPPEEIRKFRT